MKKIFIILALFVVIFPSVVFANDLKFDPQVDIPGMSDVFGQKQEGGYSIECDSIGKYIIVVYRYAVGTVGIVSAIVLMWGGFVWLTAAGNSERIGNAKSWIAASLSGLVIVLASYMILYIVNPDLVSFKPICPQPKKPDNINWELGNGCCQYSTNSLRPVKTCMAQMSQAYCDDVRSKIDQDTNIPVFMDVKYVPYGTCDTEKNICNEPSAEKITGCCKWRENGEFTCVQIDKDRCDTLHKKDGAIWDQRRECRANEAGERDCYYKQ